MSINKVEYFLGFLSNIASVKFLHSVLTAKKNNETSLTVFRQLHTVFIKRALSRHFCDFLGNYTEILLSNLYSSQKHALNFRTKIAINFLQEEFIHNIFFVVTDANHSNLFSLILVPFN